MKKPEEIFKERYSHAFDLMPGFEAVFIEVVNVISEEYASQSKWIDVYECDPPEKKPIIIFDGDSLISGYFVGCRYFNASYDSVTDAKYWMPLPEAPKDNSGTAESA